jgi:hypothetical protein
MKPDIYHDCGHRLRKHDKRKRVQKKEEEYYEGKGCLCEARSESECGCSDVDWTPKEVYALRESNQNLRSLVDAQAREIISLYATVSQLREELDSLK